MDIEGLLRDSNGLEDFFGDVLKELTDAVLPELPRNWNSIPKI